MTPYLKVRGKSMEPLCQEGDFILVDKVSYLAFRPRVGDVVVLKHPTEEKRLIVKYITQEKMHGEGSLYWVEGLNKKGSSDSRTFGWISRDLILGKALIIQRSRAKELSTGMV
jgi:nickel-type superoxide dismutase maturation protease